MKRNVGKNGFHMPQNFAQHHRKDLSNAFTTWGQFLIHDVLQTPDAFTKFTNEDDGRDENRPTECDCDERGVLPYSHIFFGKGTQ